VPVSAGMIIALPAELITPPLKNGHDLGESDVSALVAGGTATIRGGDRLVFVKVAGVTGAVVRRDGRIQAEGKPFDYARMGPMEDWLDAHAGPGVIDAIAGRAELDGKHVKGEYRRLLPAAFMIRALVLWTLMPDARICDVVALLAGDLALLPWSEPWHPASERACLSWRLALGSAPLAELEEAVLAAARREHAPGDGPSLTTGTKNPKKVKSMDGSLLRVPGTPANRAFFGSVGTADDSAAYPSVRLFPLTGCHTRSLAAMPRGAAGTGKAASEQALLDAAMRDYPHVLSMDQVWLQDRLWHGVPRMRELSLHTHFLARLKSGIPLKPVSPMCPDQTYLAEISGDGVTMTVRVIEYDVTVAGQPAGEMYCTITTLLDWEDYPGHELACLYKWRWDGSGTALREDKAPLHGNGPGTGPMLRSGSPALIAQEIPAWSAGTEMTRDITRDAARTAAPARKGRRAGLPVRSRDLSLTGARRLILAAAASGGTRYKALISKVARNRVIADRNRHRKRLAKSPGTFPHTGRELPTFIGKAVVTMANASG
jgi:hypothetical protein